MFNFYILTFMFFLFLGTFISISSYSWIGMWMGMEMNLLSMIPLMNNSKNLLASESSLKYFITQALASMILMFSIIMMMTLSSTMNNLIFSPYLMIIMNSSLLTKMGAAPFHFWFPEVMEGLNWNNSIIILTWQKISPMILVMYNMNMPMFMTMMIIFSMVISGTMGINQVSLRKILAYSSINHMGWMLSSMMFLESIWLIYFFVYTIMTINICLMLKEWKIFYLKNLFMSMNSCSLTKLFFSMNFLSLGGLPPFIGFLPKWLTIQIMVENNFIFMALLMVVSTLITLYFYIRITLSSLVLKINELNWLTFNDFKFNQKSLIFMMNIFTILGLLLSPMILNWL